MHYFFKTRLCSCADSNIWNETIARGCILKRFCFQTINIFKANQMICCSNMLSETDIILSDINKLKKSSVTFSTKWIVISCCISQTL